MKCPYSCRSADHVLSRRSFVGGLSGGAAVIASGLGGVLAASPAVAEQLKAKPKHILNIFMHGGVSQLESWDPKPNTDTGGTPRTATTTPPAWDTSACL